MDSSYNNLWAKLVSLYPHKENVDLLPSPDQANQHQVDGEWKIYQDPTGDTKIVCLSSSCLKVDNEWLGMNQEMKLLGGEMIALSEERNRADDSFDYVFCLSNENSEKSENSGDELKRKRDEIEESKFDLLTNKVQKFQGEMNEELICAICMELISDCATLSPCLHSFCNDCVTSFRKFSTACPTCRQKISFANKNPLLNKLIESIKSTFSNLGEAKRSMISNQNSQSLDVSKVFQDEEGEFLDGNGEGKGKIYFENGDFYEGSWRNCKREGYGRMKYSDGDFYQGHWENDKREGHGEMKYLDGDIYKGHWKDDKLEGKGEYRFKDGDIYRGNWRKSKMIGKGKVISKDGGIYEGEMKDLDRHGKGVLTFKDRFVLQGKWRKDKLIPVVTIDYNDGTEYKGVINPQTFKRNGKGRLKYHNGDVYQGDFAFDNFNGKGIYSWKNGERYNGGFISGKRNGQGTFKYANGDKFSGYWKDCKRNGKGELVLANKDVLKGTWSQDLPQLPVRIKYTNGDRYEGEINPENFQKHGKGVLTFNNGNQYNGFWANDKFIDADRKPSKE